jgi:hypothetical protein
VGVPLVGVAALYVIAAFAAPSPLLRIALRCAPILPLAIWTIWFDRSRPLEHHPPMIRSAGRALLLILVMAFVIAVLGLGLNWLYDPNRVV